jgi:hypothetical protein
MRWIWAVAGAAGCVEGAAGTNDTGIPTDGTDTNVVYTLPTDQTVDCTSDSYWEGGDRESSLMHPGLDCVACHADRGEGPQYEIAGTVMGGLYDVDDCNGVEDVVVRITDADGDVTELSTNSAGNFFLRSAVATPYTAEIEYDGLVRRMVTPQTDGQCNACHTDVGASSAPGRVVTP